jgi:hypothetical protein
MSAAPPIMQTIGWVRLIQFVGSKGWSVELTEHGHLCLRKDGSAVLGPDLTPAPMTGSPCSTASAKSTAA